WHLALPRVGTGSAQALLPAGALRAAGGGNRGRDRAVAVHQPQLPAARGGQLPAPVLRGRRAGAGTAGCAAVRGALALECRHGAGAAAFLRWQAGAAAAAADEVRGPAGHGIPRPGRVPGEHRRRARGAARWSRRRCRTACTRRWTAPAGWKSCAAWRRAASAWWRAIPPRPRRWRPRRSTRGPTPPSTTHRGQNGAPRPRSRAAVRTRNAPPTPRARTQ